MLSGEAEPLLEDFAARGTVLLYFCNGKSPIARACPINRRLRRSRRRADRSALRCAPASATRSPDRRLRGRAALLRCPPRGPSAGSWARSACAFALLG